jgi:hypothetical protein
MVVVLIDQKSKKIQITFSCLQKNLIAKDAKDEQRTLFQVKRVTPFNSAYFANTLRTLR